jgi:glycerol-3-phosphate dehydrogenase (NAD(P)+)
VLIDEAGRVDICVVGSGNWGTTLAIMQCQAGRRTVLCTRDAARAQRILEQGENTESLPGIPIPSDLRVVAGYAAAEHADYVLVAVPSVHIRAVCRALRPHLGSGPAMVSAAKGLETRTGLRVSEMMLSELGEVRKLCVLSGPNLAREIATGLPAAAVLACADRAIAVACAAAIGTRLFRLYTSEDVIGVELGGALKNVVALAAGICDGLEMGSNGKAAIVTRGMAEIVRLGQACGADPLTFAGLSGYGDLFATCNSALSRNHYVGEQLGRGQPLPRILSSMTMVAEGINTAQAARDLAARHKVELPITNEILAVLFHGKEPRAAMDDLLSRLMRDEQTGLPQLSTAARESASAPLEQC